MIHLMEIIVENLLAYTIIVNEMEHEPKFKGQLI